MHTMSADMKKIPLGPPPSYDTPPLDLGDGKKQSNVGLFSLLMEDPPPYKENNSPTEWKLEVGSRKSEVRSGKWEVRSGKWEVRSLTMQQ